MTKEITRRNAFSVEGGEQLATIGATFFVSYLYYQHVDPNHNNWSSIKTKSLRIGAIARSKQHHHAWLDHIGGMNDAKLSTNTLGFDGVSVKELARAILRKL